MKRVLVANRGEIALRIMRTCREMGIETVAVFSEADRLAPFVRFADHARCIGPAPSNESYLKVDNILQVAKELEVDGIHPGYGFLSENADFARKVADAGIEFIGPYPEAIHSMGSKLEAKRMAQENNVPLVPGTAEAVEDVQEALNIGKEIGFPLLIKASAGGGGKGMRVVEKEEEFEEQLERASSEALSSFGDGSVFIEKFVTSPRHIEIQILADKHGNYVYLFERDCSVQRRHQKVIEEAPSAVLTEEKRKAMGECAIRIAKACNYIGAGTVEFLYDADGSFYFLEMNTRLQVEHPVTEMITSIDLVAEQIRVARGEKLAFTQEDVSINGHAIEVRVYAEDPTNNFLPDIGKLKRYDRPQGPGIRVDDGFEEGMDIPIYYDPMIAKLVVHAPDRVQAIERMIRAIQEYRITGVKTTLNFCSFALGTEAFRSGDYDTRFVKLYFKPEELDNVSDPELEEVAAILATHVRQDQENSSVTVKSSSGNSVSNWRKIRTQP